MWINSFDGFNSPLQKVHFRENYLETQEFKQAIFEGRVIEKIDMDAEGSQLVRAKGYFLIHGVKKERIIDINLKVEEGNIYFNSEFFVKLSDHDIDIPSIVYQKIAQEIKVSVEGELEKR